MSEMLVESRGIVTQETLGMFSQLVQVMRLEAINVDGLRPMLSPSNGLVVVTDPADVRVACIRGGASFRSRRFGWMSLGWPFVTASADHSGFAIRIRSRRLRRLARDSGELASGWSGSKRIDVSRRALVLYLRDGRSCRFVALRRATLNRLLVVISAHDVELRRVPNTLGWILRGGS